MHIALKAGKQWSTNFSSPPLLDTFLHKNPQEHATQPVLLSPDTIPFNFIPLLRVVNNFSMPLKLMFYQNTYITAILWRVHGLSLVFPNSDIITWFPLWQWRSDKQLCMSLHQFIATKLTGKHAQSSFRHQSTSRLTFDFHHINSTVQWQVKIKPSLMA